MKQYKCATGRYRLWVEALDGLCIYPGKARSTKAGIMWVNSERKGKRRLTVLIHEWIHAELGDGVSEAIVNKLAETLASIVWDQGYRRAGEKRNGGSSRTKRGAGAPRHKTGKGDAVRRGR